MASDEDDGGKAIAAGLLGFGLGALLGAALMSPPKPRAVFERRVREGLAQHEIGLASAELGRGSATLVWLLVLKLPTGSLMSVQAIVPPHTDPVAVELADDIVLRIVEHVRPYRQHVA